MVDNTSHCWACDFYAWRRARVWALSLYHVAVSVKRQPSIMMRDIPGAGQERRRSPVLVWHHFDINKSSTAIPVCLNLDMIPIDQAALYGSLFKYVNRLPGLALNWLSSQNLKVIIHTFISIKDWPIFFHKVRNMKHIWKLETMLEYPPNKCLPIWNTIKKPCNNVLALNTLISAEAHWLLLIKQKCLIWDEEHVVKFIILGNVSPS